MNDLPPKIGHCLIIECLGRGTSGIVYKAKDLDRVVALKTPFLHPPAERSQRAMRLMREARSVAACRHPNIAAMYFVTDPGPTPYLIREFVEGEDLERLAASGRLSLLTAIKILHQVAMGVESVHRQGCVHRNLHPANVLVGVSGEVKLIGFSKARAVDDLNPPMVTPSMDVQSLEEMLDWLCDCVRNPLPVGVDPNARPGSAKSASEFASALATWLADVKGA